MAQTFKASYIFLHVFLISLIIETAHSFRINGSAGVLDYLTQYGYLQDPSLHPHVPLTGDNVRQALQDFQLISHIAPAGFITEDTLKEMNQPRCGNHDQRFQEEYHQELQDQIHLKPRLRHAGKHRGRQHQRTKRQTSPRAYRIPKWNKLILTYRIERFPSRNINGMTPRVVQSEFDHAFRYWQRVSSLRFLKLSNPELKPDITIKFLKGDHGDRSPFDGPGKTLAHGFYPRHGDIHLDDEERWAIGYKWKHYDLRTVSVHEIGHVIGLVHSNNSNSVMYSRYEGFRGNNIDKFNLHPADIHAVQAVYGPSTSAPPKKKSKKKPLTRTLPDLCKNIRIDAITVMPDNFTYIFHGKYFFRSTNISGKVTKSGPKLISKNFSGLPNRLDAAVTIRNNTYFFKGSLVWRTHGFHMDPTFPKNISTQFPGMPSNLDAVTTWSWNNKVYFFKGKQYWKYDHVQTPSGKAYPADVNFNWPGIPNSVDAAFKSSNGYTYFFKDRKYYMFHDPNSIHEATYYPRGIDEWFGCKSNEVVQHQKKHS